LWGKKEEGRRLPNGRKEVAIKGAKRRERNKRSVEEDLLRGRRGSYWKMSKIREREKRGLGGSC